ncbi:LPXTG cell wall anchor domain-containing protein [Ruminococcus sp. Marseille-P328]|nr:LPXTG cell wall anchor domain-containing protein [uncultured Blautia sp.]
MDAVKQKNPFILLGVGVALIAAIGGLIWSKKR